MAAISGVSAYRNLLRSISIVFKGDSYVMKAARDRARMEFQDGRSLDPQSPEAQQKLQHATEVAQFLKANIVQGERVDDKNHMYKLRIHEHTERGDNDSLKPKGGCAA